MPKWCTWYSICWSLSHIDALHPPGCGACSGRIFESAIGIWNLLAKLHINTVKPVLSGQSKRTPKLVFNTNYRLMQVKEHKKLVFNTQLSLNAGQKYCRMLQGEHSAILSTSISYLFPLRPLFCLFLCGCLRQVLLYLYHKYRKIIQPWHAGDMCIYSWYWNVPWIFLKMQSIQLNLCKTATQK